MLMKKIKKKVRKKKMNIIFNLTRQYESHGLLVLNRLVRLGDNVEKGFDTYK
jgi:hypothetical protein